MTGLPCRTPSLMAMAKTCRNVVSAPLNRVGEKSAAHRLAHSWHYFSVILTMPISIRPGHVFLSASNVSSLYPLCTRFQVGVGLELRAIERHRVTEGQRPVVGLPAAATRLRRSSASRTSAIVRTVVSRLNRNCLSPALNFVKYMPDGW